MAPDLFTLFNELIRFETELWNTIDAELRAKHNLPLSKFEPMRVIANTSDCRVYDVATALSLTTGGTSKLIDTLEAARLCERAPNPSDRRSSILKLTPAGKRALKRADTTCQQVLADCLGGLPATTLERFTSSLVQMRRALTTNAARSSAA